MKNKLGLFLLVFGLFGSVVMGCGNEEGTSETEEPSGEQGQQEVEISYLTHWAPPQVEQLKEAIARYEEQHANVTVQVRAVPFGNLLSTLSTQSNSSTAPTIASIYDLWLPELVKNEIVTPAPESYTQDIQEHYPANVVEAARVDENQYGYPNEVDLYALNYNEALFEEAGLSEPPENWEELIEYSKKLTKRDDAGNITQQGFGLINSWNSGVVHPWLSMVFSNGGQLLNEDYQPQVTSDAALEVTQLYQQMIQEANATSPAMGKANASTTGPYLNNFANGKTAMIIMANWWESALRDSMGDQFSNVKTAPIPVGPNGESSHSVSYSWMTVVNNHSTDAQQAAAWDFLQWLNSPESGENGSSAMGNILMSMGILPSRDADLEAHQDELNDPFIQTYVEALENAKPFPIVLGGNEITTRLQKQLESMEFGDATPQEVLEQASQEMENVLNSYYTP